MLQIEYRSILNHNLKIQVLYFWDRGLENRIKNETSIVTEQV